MFNFLLWKDHAVTPSNTYNLVKNDDGTYTLTPAASHPAGHEHERGQLQPP